jgi:threonine dehydratase
MPSNAAPCVTFDDIVAARRRIADRLVLSALVSADALSETAKAKVFFKLESMQQTGSYKERGALNRLLLTPREQLDCGVVAASAGNHAQALALHATRLGVKATIVMPEWTPLVKVVRTRRFGGNVVLHGASYDEAYAYARELCEREGQTYIHAFNDPHVIAGQGTVGLEMLEQNPYLQAIVVPIGGGGLIAGMACAIKETNPSIRVIGVETEAVPSMKASIAAGHTVTVAGGKTIADGIAVRTPGSFTFDLVQRYVDEIVTVNEEEIASAIILMLEEEKVVSEGAGAVGVAAVVQQKLPSILGKRVGVVITGGNIDLNLVSHIIERGLVKAGRKVRLHLTIPDVPGALARLTQIVAHEAANILEIHHDRDFSPISFGETDVSLSLETRGYEHIERLKERLNREGYLVRNLGNGDPLATMAPRGRDA